MSTAAPEFSRVVRLARLGTDPFRQELAASKAERAALAQRFDLVSLDRLTAVVELVRQGPAMILLRASFAAEFVQSCVVTLDPVEGAVSESFALRYGPPEAEEEAGAGTAEDDIAFEPLAADFIDIGEAVAQEFSLVLPAFPRDPEASLEMDQAEVDDGPFTPLSRLANRREP
jgi:uncharacterized metal-binding protein YceD (DUF177 family)